MNQPLRLKSSKLSAHLLLHRLKDVLQEHPALFEWEPTERGDASHITHASFDFRERVPEVPPFEIHVERLDNEFVALSIADGDDLTSDAAEYRQFIEQSFYRLYETAMTTKKEEIGQLTFSV